MERWVFNGRVLPAHVQVSFETAKFNWQSPLEIFSAIIQTTVVASVVKTEAITPIIGNEIYLSLLKRASDFTQVCLDILAFSTARPMQLVFETVEQPDGAVAVIDVNHADLATECTAFSPANFGEILPMITDELGTWRIFRDLIDGISNFNRADVNCARALEGMKHTVAGAVSNEKHAWERLRATLNLTEAFLRPITEVSKQNRHGKAEHIPGPELMEVVRRTWIVANRFLEWLKRRKTALPAANFPVL